MSNTLKLALAQTNIIWEDKAANQKICEKFARQAARQHADLLIFPEMTLTGFSMNVKAIAEDEKHSPTVEFFRSLAHRWGLAILFGAVFKGRGGLGKNVAILVGPDGRARARYQKIHPFSMAHEDRHFEVGKALTFFSLKGWRFGVFICYDLRFPGLFEAMARFKPDGLIGLANWPKKRLDHWRSLLKARALDTQAYSIGINRTSGLDAGASFQASKNFSEIYSGGSAVFDPWGEKCLSLGSRPQLGYAVLDKAVVAKCRQNLTSLKDKKFGLYEVAKY